MVNALRHTRVQSIFNDEPIRVIKRTIVMFKLSCCESRSTPCFVIMRTLTVTTGTPANSAARHEQFTGNSSLQQRDFNKEVKFNVLTMKYRDRKISKKTTLLHRSNTNKRK